MKRCCFVWMCDIKLNSKTEKRKNVETCFLRLTETLSQLKAGVKKIKDIVDTALASDSFKTLCKAVIAAGLVEALKGSGPFTVFAPTDDAFAKLPEGTVKALLKDKKKLAEILKYHVVARKLMVTDFKTPKNFKTLQGQEVRVDGLMWHIKKSIKVNDAKTVKTDIQATNGVIHAIDSVLMPK